jgi:hypothetical protein
VLQIRKGEIEKAEDLSAPLSIILLLICGFLKSKKFLERINDSEMPGAACLKLYCCGALLALKTLTAPPSNNMQIAN